MSKRNSTVATQPGCEGSSDALSLLANSDSVILHSSGYNTQLDSNNEQHLRTIRYLTTRGYGTVRKNEGQVRLYYLGEPFSDIASGDQVYVGERAFLKGVAIGDGARNWRINVEGRVFFTPSKMTNVQGTIDIGPRGSVVGELVGVASSDIEFRGTGRLELRKSTMHNSIRNSELCIDSGLSGIFIGNQLYDSILRDRGSSIRYTLNHFHGGQVFALDNAFVDSRHNTFNNRVMAMDSSFRNTRWNTFSKASYLEAMGNSFAWANNNDFSGGTFLASNDAFTNAHDNKFISLSRLEAYDNVFMNNYDNTFKDSKMVATERAWQNILEKNNLYGNIVERLLSAQLRSE